MQILYPDTEKSKLDEVDDLLKSWKETVSEARVKWRDNGKYYSGNDWFSCGVHRHRFNFLNRKSS
jgi:hypothetical protein